jgi:hypothetical protein
LPPEPLPPQERLTTVPVEVRMRSRSYLTCRSLAAVLAAVALAACGDDDNAPAPAAGPGEGGLPAITPAQLSRTVNNPLFPLPVGARWVYRATTEDGVERTVVEVLPETHRVWDVDATVVRDRVFLDGELIEDTFDWFAQDTEGNVWYLGEDTRELEDGKVVSTEGSWAAGVDGALPGVVMWADPAAHLGQEYPQERAEGVAEDRGKVVAVNESVSVPAGSFTGCVRTEDWNALEPDVLENKTYCPQVGLVLEVMVRGGTERTELVERRAP